MFLGVKFFLYLCRECLFVSIISYVCYKQCLCPSVCGSHKMKTDVSDKFLFSKSTPMNQIVRIIFTLFAFVMTISVANAQDLLARQAPVDRRMRAADSVALQRLIDKERYNYADNSLYDTWDTNRVHCYQQARIPDNFRVDLRGFTMPTPSRQITSNFGYRAAFRRQHRGLDIKVYTGDTIYAAFDGKVRIVNYEAAGYGNYVVIRHPNGLETIYGHLSKHLVSTNDVVKSGQPIGLGGNTGRSTGSHLHFETRILGVAIDPKLMFDFPNQDVVSDFFVYTGQDQNEEYLPQVAVADVTKNDAGTKAESKSKRETKREKAERKKNKGQGRFYKIEKGDNLYTISSRLGTTVDQICQMNSINKDAKIRPGQILRY